MSNEKNFIQAFIEFFAMLLGISTEETGEEKSGDSGFGDINRLRDELRAQAVQSKIPTDIETRIRIGSYTAAVQNAKDHEREQNRQRVMAIAIGFKLSDVGYTRQGEYEALTPTDSPIAYYFKNGKLSHTGILPGTYGRVRVGKGGISLEGRPAEKTTTGIIPDIVQRGQMFLDVYKSWLMFSGQTFSPYHAGTYYDYVNSKQSFAELNRQPGYFWPMYAWRAAAFGSVYPFSPPPIVWQNAGEMSGGIYTASDVNRMQIPFSGSGANLPNKLEDKLFREITGTGLSKLREPIREFDPEQYMYYAAFDRTPQQVQPGDLSNDAFQFRLNKYQSSVRFAVWTIEALRAVNKIPLPKWWMDYATAWGVRPLRDEYLQTWDKRQARIRKESKHVRVRRDTMLADDTGQLAAQYVVSKSTWEGYADFMYYAAPWSDPFMISPARRAFDLPASFAELTPRYLQDFAEFETRFGPVQRRYKADFDKYLAEQSAREQARAMRIFQAWASVLTMGAGLAASGVSIGDLAQEAGAILKNAPQAAADHFKSFVGELPEKFGKYVQSYGMEFVNKASATIAGGRESLVEKTASLTRAFDGVPAAGDFANLTPDKMLGRLERQVSDAVSDGYEHVDEAFGALLPVRSVDDLDPSIGLEHRASVSQFNFDGDGAISIPNKIKSFELEQLNKL